MSILLSCKCQNNAEIKLCQLQSEEGDQINQKGFVFVQLSIDTVGIFGNATVMVLFVCVGKTNTGTC